MQQAFQVMGANDNASFTLKVHRGEGMALLAMNWKTGQPTKDFAGFAIEYQEPGSSQFWPLKNRLSFPGTSQSPQALSTLQSPIQKFRWVHFPLSTTIPGNITYRVTPVFMDAAGKLTYGEPQTAVLSLADETYPGQLN